MEPTDRVADGRLGRLSLDFALPPAVAALQREAEDFAAAAVERFGQVDDAWICGYSRELSRELGRRGWIGMAWPTDVGGGGRSPLERFVVAEALIAAGAPIAASWFADRQIGPTLIAYGTTDQRSRFLPGILAGETGWCIGMSEPDAGSDLAGLSTAARRDGDHFVIDGQKMWTSFGRSADYCYLICRTSSDGPRHRGISEIVVPMDLPGIDVRPIRDMTGAEHFCEVFFDDVRVPVGNLVGEEGRSFRQTMRQLEHERGGIDRLLSNLALYRAVRSRADTTAPLVRQAIARIETGYRLGRLLVLREVLGQAPKGFSAATKVFCTEHEQAVAEFVAATVGPEATLWGRAGRGISYAPAYTIMGGTSTILRNILGERSLDLPRAPGS